MRLSPVNLHHDNTFVAGMITLGVYGSVLVCHVSVYVTIIVVGVITLVSV